MRVLIVSENLATPSAGDQIARGLGKVLLAAGHEIAFFSPEPLPPNEPKLQGVKVFSAPKGGLLGYVVNAAQARAMDTAVEAFRPDIAHLVVLGHVGGLSHNVIKVLHDRGIATVNAPVSYIPMCMNTYFYRKGVGVCYLCNGHQYRWGVRYLCGGEHGSLTQWVAKHLQRKTLSEVSLWLSTNPDFDRALLAYGIPASRIMRTYHPFDWDRVAGVTPQAGDAFVFNAQCRVEKGAHIFPEIFKRVQGCRFELYFWSQLWPDLDKLRSEKNDVFYTFDLHWDTGVKAALARARAAVLPTVNPSFGELAVYEAMALSKPVVAFRVGANPLLLRDQVDGFLAQEGDVAALAAAVERLQDQPGLALEMGQAARERASELFGEEAVSVLMAQAYHQALGRS